jgi:hypothetical protein
MIMCSLLRSNRLHPSSWFRRKDGGNWFFQDIGVFVHSVTQKSIAWIFLCPEPEVTWRYSCHHNSSLLLSPYLCIRGISLCSLLTVLRCIRPPLNSGLMTLLSRPGQFSAFRNCLPSFFNHDHCELPKCSCGRHSLHLSENWKKLDLI